MEDNRELIKNKLCQYFDGKIVRKDLKKNPYFNKGSLIVSALCIYCKVLS